MKPVVVELIRQVQAIVFDFDGVLTDNRELIGQRDASVIKRRSHYDGQGISLLRDAGLRVAIATNEEADDARAARFLTEKWNSLPSTKPEVMNPWLPIKLFTGVGHTKKAEAVLTWLRELGIGPVYCAVMGDDLVDVPLLRAVGFRAAPSTAEQVVKDMVHFVSERPAGAGAVRDFVNFLLEARGIDQTTLRPF